MTDFVIVAASVLQICTVVKLIQKRKKTILLVGGLTGGINLTNKSVTNVLTQACT